MHLLIDMLNIFLRVLTILLVLVRDVYWYVTGKIAKKAKPPTKKSFSFQSAIGWVFSLGLEIIILMQLAGMVSLLPIPHQLLLFRAIGCIVCFVGVGVCLLARHTLGVNWSHAADYQIKTHHELVTTGLYHLVRHPIYTGLALSWIGAEMVAGSYLSISFLAFFIAFYFQGKREEKILLTHFGKTYADYMKKTKMLIPFVF